MDSHKCKICLEKVPIYRCPLCGIETCSLPCVQKHKETTGCSGQRDRSGGNVRRGEWGDSELKNDLFFLEGVSEGVRRLGNKRNLSTTTLSPCNVKEVANGDSKRSPKRKATPSGILDVTGRGDVQSLCDTYVNFSAKSVVPLPEDVRSHRKKKRKGGNSNSSTSSANPEAMQSLKTSVSTDINKVRAQLQSRVGSEITNLLVMPKGMERSSVNKTLVAFFNVGVPKRGGITQKPHTEIFQKDTTPGKGNALQCCVASVFCRTEEQMSANDPPNFVEDDRGYLEAIKSYVQGLNMCVHKVPLVSSGRMKYSTVDARVLDGRLCILRGGSPRGDFGHVVVARANRVNEGATGEITFSVIHDPFPSGGGLDSKVDFGWLMWFSSTDEDISPREPEIYWSVEACVFNGEDEGGGGERKQNKYLFHDVCENTAVSEVYKTYVMSQRREGDSNQSSEIGTGKDEFIASGVRCLIEILPNPSNSRKFREIGMDESSPSIIEVLKGMTVLEFPCFYFFEKGSDAAMANFSLMVDASPVAC